MYRIAMLAAALALGMIAPTAAADPLEDAVLAELNYARQDPRGYAADLRRYRSYYRGNRIYLPGRPDYIISREGVAAVDEAIAFLERQRPLPALTPGQVLALAARDHALAQGPIGGMGHVSRDGASPGERVRRRGGDIYVGETISYGAPDGGEVVRNLIIDDGVPDRGHRTLIFTADFRFAGVGCGRHARYSVICVVDYAGTPNGKPVMMAAAAPRMQKPATITRNIRYFVDESGALIEETEEIEEWEE